MITVEVSTPELDAQLRKAIQRERTDRGLDPLTEQAETTALQVLKLVVDARAIKGTSNTTYEADDVWSVLSEPDPVVETALYTINRQAETTIARMTSVTNACSKEISQEGDSLSPAIISAGASLLAILLRKDDRTSKLGSEVWKLLTEEETDMTETDVLQALEAIEIQVRELPDLY